MDGQTKALVILVASAFLYSLFHHFALAATCRYCGERWGHDVHCPYKDVL
jgi:hypothetical protein